MAWMRKGRARDLGFVVLVAVVALACSSSSSPGGGADAGAPIDAAALETGPSIHDASPPSDGSLASVDAGPCDPSTSATGCCDPRTPYTANPWSPPAPFQNACTSSQITSYNTCSDMGDCSNFRTATANAACLACIETDFGRSTWGPVITETQSGVTFAVLINYGGCEALRDGDTSARSCGAENNDNVDCLYSACGGCVDWSTSGPMATACTQAAAQSGGCRAFASTPACLDEQADGGIASGCGPNLVDVLAYWCGGGGLAAVGAEPADAEAGDGSTQDGAGGDSASGDATSSDAAATDAADALSPNDG
jgi:hypothetical protein